MDKKSQIKLARLAVRTGINIQKGQTLIINSPIECAAFARFAAAEAYEAGAHDVVMNWSDEKFARLRYEKAPEEVFEEFPDWRYRFYMDYAKEGAAFLSVSARDPEIFNGISPTRLLTAQKTAGMALVEYRERIMKSRNTWCVISVPTAGWAKKVFPDLPPEQAAEKLWDEILQSVRISGADDPVEVWKRHIQNLSKAADFLNGHDFHSLHYQNSLGTDLVIELPEGHIWAGGAEYSEDGTLFVANMPTEEVFTAPKRDGVNGVVFASRPLVYQGNLIEKFRVEFKDGRVVKYSAERGEEHLKALFETDDGSNYLGEVALVQYDSPISKSGVLFYNTLFDENASCHLAFGKAYPSCIKDGSKLNSVELIRRGLNDSLKHEDFMVGTEDLSITGRKKDGSEVPVFVNGNFAF